MLPYFFNFNLYEQAIESDAVNRIKLRRLLGETRYEKLLSEVTTELQKMIKKVSPEEAKKIEVTDIEIVNVNFDRKAKIIFFRAEIFITEGHHAALEVSINVKNKSWKLFPFLGI